MKFGIVVSDIAAAQDLSRKIEKYLEGKGHEVVREGSYKGCEVILTLGGDGTLIHAACEHVDANAPLFGINAGTLGFLTAVERSEWREAVDKVIKGDYVTSERMTLDASIVHSSRLTVHSYRALNEVVVKGMYRVIDLEVVVNDQKFLDVSGDGVIVSTPTGSTAYSLSAGGPIVDPEIDCLLVTPVNAVGLPIPSVVLSSDDVIEIKIVDGEDVSLVVDGQEHTKISQSPASAEASAGKQSVKVERGRYRVKFGYFDKHHFLKALKSLDWRPGRGDRHQG